MLFTRNIISLDHLKTIFTDKVFVCGLLARTSMIFAFSGIHFWYCDYLLNGLSILNLNERIFSYSIVAIFSPVIGIILGGMLSISHQNKHTVMIVFIFQFIACFSSIFVPFNLKIVSFSCNMAIYFIFTSASTPILTSITLSNLSNKLQIFTMSLSSIIIFLFGNASSPFIYGMFNDIYKSTNKHFAMGFLSYYSFTALIFILFTAHFRYLIQTDEINNGKAAQIGHGIAHVFEDNILPNDSDDSDDTNFDLKELNNTLPRSIRWFLYIVMVIIAIFSSVDGGVIPAATEEIRKALGLNDTDLGTFGSVDFVGRCIGSILFMWVINKINRKYLMVFCLILKALTLFLFLITKDVLTLNLSRGLSGLCQVYFTIYPPVWCDQYGVQNAKTMMITLIQVGNPVGIVVGFVLTTMLNNDVIIYNFIVVGDGVCPGRVDPCLISSVHGVFST